MQPNPKVSRQKIKQVRRKKNRRKHSFCPAKVVCSRCNFVWLNTILEFPACEVARTSESPAAQNAVPGGINGQARKTELPENAKHSSSNLMHAANPAVQRSDFA